ncbi:hypothetical protein AMES_0485 [Amycolatopsis mediterranei S699]|uniref:Uncharacterized protein n=2 Tax=Amycolatopsis mediterranei TaxID=33910 RepID=A0A0H3CUM1_AMYMU|nr:hypothetical protein [Amycolatopsis mediterranei]ADJ42307.1 conserved hypothetical protein [Amycolatopsis mediterranei U32]AEK38991.1 hypothetical protein RAM_02495 [Amycolatopsis mediterranei S699]AFO74021.1 hypothetical protein AMES_0485 [Amycolatopsis mediterranei S699]AGT81150.1 hypothetical protein B737_0486 [Amycolatopsis mediterranei RB]KDO09785.1 hypothetical protein DV26_17085 [Amycolatopsis mediterranei]
MEDKEDLTGLTDDERRKRGRSPDPVLPGERAPKAAPPRPVAVSFWLWLAGGVVLILGYVQLLTGKSAVIDRYVKGTTDPKITPQMIADGVTAMLWFLLVGSAVFSLLFLLFAYKAREGTRSARTVLTVLPIVMLLLIFTFAPVLTYLTLVAVLLFVIALVLLYLPSVSGYFPKVGKKP